MKIKQIRRIFLIAAIVLSILLIGSWVFLRYYLSPVIASKLKTTIVEKTDSLYQLEFETLHFNPFSGRFQLNLLSLKPDTTRLKTSETDVFVEIDIPFFQIQNISLHELLINRQFCADKLQCTNALVRLKRMPADSSHTQQDTVSQKPQRFFPLFFEKVLIENTELYVIDYQTNNTIFSFQNLTLNISQLNAKELNSDSINFEQITLQATGFNLPLADSLDRLSFDSLTFDTKNNNLIIKNFRHTPCYPPENYLKHAGFHKKHVDITIDKIELQNIDYKKIIDDNYFQTSALVLDSFQMNIHNDKTSDLPPKLKFLAQDYIRNVPLVFNIDSVEVSNGRITYTEKDYGSNIRIFLADANIKAYHFTNDSLLYNEQDLTASFTASFMGQSPLWCQLQMPLSRKDNQHTVSGQLSSIDLPNLSVLLENSGIRIKNGYSPKLTFRITANNDKAWGELEFLYNDLKVELLNLNKEKRKRRLLSFVSNIAIHNNNPKGRQPPYKAPMAAEYNPEKSFVAFWLNSIISGVKTTILPGRS